MKSLVILTFIAFLMLALDTGAASLIAGGRMKSKGISDRKTAETPYICLDPPTDLLPCNFPEGGNERINFRRRRSRAYEDVPNPIDSEHSSSRHNSRENDRAVTIVYKIEGCIPPRLPFFLPMCQSKDIIGRRVDVQKLLPFIVPSDPKKDSRVPPLIFPDLDMNQWHKSMNGPWTRPVNEDETTERSTVRDKVEETTESLGEKLRKRKKFYPDMFDDKRISGIPERLKLSRPSRHSSRHASDHYEFPYEKAIPFDPKKLPTGKNQNPEFFGVHDIAEQGELRAVAGDIFPYAIAIPYNSEKLEARRNAGIQRSSHSSGRRLLSVQEADNSHVRFDASEGAASGVKPEDASKSLETMKLLSSGNFEKERVPMGHTGTKNVHQDVRDDAKNRFRNGKKAIETSA